MKMIGGDDGVVVVCYYYYLCSSYSMRIDRSPELMCDSIEFSVGCWSNRQTMCAGSNVFVADYGVG